MSQQRISHFFPAERRVPEATRPTAQEVLRPRQRQSTLPLRVPVQHWDDSQATAISEEEFEPAVVTSPLSGWDFEYEDIENLSPGEASVPADHPIGGGDPQYIPVPTLVENSEGIVYEGYWQRHAGKKSVKKVIRKYFMTGKCKWGGIAWFSLG